MESEPIEVKHDKTPNLKLVMNPEGKLHDWNDLPEEEVPDELQVAYQGNPEIAKRSKKVEFSQVFRLPGFCRAPTNTFAKLPINSGHLFMRPSPQIQMLDLAGFVIFPCLWNICILWNVECIMNWTVAHVFNSFKASFKCTHM